MKISTRLMCLSGFLWLSGAIWLLLFCGRPEFLVVEVLMAAAIGIPALMLLYGAITGEGIEL
jgi:hypothetical protein